MSNPQRVDLTERKFVGIPRRAAIVIGVSLAAGFALILALPANLLIRLIAGATVALAGLSLAFLKVDGLNPEAWLLESLSFRRRVRHRIKGFKKAAPEPVRAQVQDASKAKPALRPKATAPSTPARPPRLAAPALAEVPAALLSALVTLFCVLVLTGLAFYLRAGGAEHVVVLLRTLNG